MEIERKIFVRAEDTDLVNRDGSSRQDLLRALDQEYGPNLELCTFRLAPYGDLGSPSYHVTADGKIVGDLPDWLARELRDYSERHYGLSLQKAAIHRDPDTGCSLSFLVCLVSPEEIQRYVRQKHPESHTSPLPQAPEPKAPKEAAPPQMRHRPRLVPLKAAVSLLLLCGSLFFFGKNTMLMDVILVLCAIFTIWWTSEFAK